MYFDQALNVSKAQTVGLSPSTGVGAIIRIDDKPQFAKLFYSTALAAQASGREVSVQMRGVSAGYLVIDRIWLDE